MSFTFTKEGVRLRRLLNNPNWNIVHKIFHNWMFYRGYSFQNKLYCSIYGFLADTFYNSVYMGYKELVPIDTLKKWFLKTIKKYKIDLLQNDLDLKKIDDICKELEKEYF